MSDVRSDRLEVMGDLLPTPEERAEMEAAFEEMERREVGAEFGRYLLTPTRGLAGAGHNRHIVFHGPEIDYGFRM